MWWFCKNAISSEDRNAMEEFIAKHREEIAGVLSGFDRLIFRGTLRSISYPEGMLGYLWAKQVRLTEFGRHVLRVSERLKQACRAKAEALKRPMKYLASAGESKEEVARGIAAREKIEEGLVCVLSCVEPCQTFDVYRNRETRKLELVSRIRKCLFLYHYWIHREFGFLNARIQTWFPFSKQVCMNGREWLARQMGRAEIHRCGVSAGARVAAVVPATGALRDNHAGEHRRGRLKFVARRKEITQISSTESDVPSVAVTGCMMRVVRLSRSIIERTDGYQESSSLCHLPSLSGAMQRSPGSHLILCSLYSIA